MNVTILEEAGRQWAALGLSLSYKREADNMPPVMDRLSDKDGGHNKFLEAIVVWIDITAPRHFWQQFDTYRTGMSKQSESTMHTLTRGYLVQDDFVMPIPEQTLTRLNDLVSQKKLIELKNELPEGFLQRRIITTNYKALRHIIGERRTHRNPGWRIFCEAVLAQVESPEYLRIKKAAE